MTITTMSSSRVKPRCGFDAAGHERVWDAEGIQKDKVFSQKHRQQQKRPAINRPS
jgi:hypothetical protein